MNNTNMENSEDEQDHGDKDRQKDNNTTTSNFNTKNENINGQEGTSKQEEKNVAEESQLKRNNDSNQKDESESGNRKKYNRIEHLRNLILDIKTILRNQEKKKNFECCCSIELPNTSLTDIFKCYSSITFCLLNHTNINKFIPELFLKSFLLELNLLEFLRELPQKIPDVLFTSENNLKFEIDKYICAYKTFMNEKKIHINCEQDIESLTYKYYKTYCSRDKNSFCDDLLLFLLFRRNESERFFNVFKRSDKTRFGYRFSLLLSLFSECCRESADIFKEIKRCRDIKEEGIIYELKNKYLCLTEDEEKDIDVALKSINLGEKKENSLSIAKDDLISLKSTSSINIISDVACLKKLLDDESMFNKLELVFDEQIKTEELDFKKQPNAFISKNEKELEIIQNRLSDDSFLILLRTVGYIYNLLQFDKDFNLWFNEKKIKMDWEVSVKKWAISREGDKRSLDHAMINHCAKFKKYEEGYLIFSMHEKKDEHCLLKTSVLCLTALKNTGDKIWIERICDLIQICAQGKMKSTCCAMTDSLLNKMSYVCDEGREILLTNLLKCLEKFHLEEDEEMINCLLKGFFSLCSECKNSKTCNLCFKYAMKLYNKWHESRESFFFFRKKSKLGDNIYSYILGVCDEHNDCDSFHKICKDILENNEKIGDNILGRLEKYHQKCKCGAFRDEYGEKNSKGLLKHCLSEFKK